MSDRTWDDAAQLILDGLFETLVSKQHDYGHDNILFAGADGVLVRAHDKIARIKNLLDRGSDAAHESLRDSWLDLAGYAVIGIMLMDGTFTRQLACDVDGTSDGFRERNLAGDYWAHSDGTFRNYPEPRDENTSGKTITEGHVKAWIAQAIAHHTHSMHETETWPRSHYINEL